MKIHLNGSNTTAIAKILQKDHHTLTLEKSSANQADNIMTSILACDAAILENTANSFTQGFETALCLDKKKPILILSNKATLESLAPHIESELINCERYTRDNLEKIIEKFIIEAGRGVEKTRFNFFIDKKLENYLDWAAHTYQTNKAEIIRDLLNEQMLKKDPKYKKYLSKP